MLWLRPDLDFYSRRIIYPPVWMVGMMALVAKPYDDPL